MWLNMARIAARSLLLSVSAIVSFAQRSSHPSGAQPDVAQSSEKHFGDTHVDGIASAGDVSAARPDVILFIVADDLGWNDIYPGSGIRTPVLNGLRDGGVTLGNYHVQPVCSPSRAAIMTGRYPIAYGLQTYVVEDGADYGVNLNETFLPQVLQSHGYNTHAVGKWHLGMCSWEYTPTFRGFNSFYGYYTGGETYFTHEAGPGYDLHNDTQPHCGPNCSVVDWSADGQYSTHLFTSAAIQVIDNHDMSEGPLFLYLAYQAVHSPAQVPDSYVWPYNASIKDAERRTFAGMIACLDEGIGNVTAALQARGWLDNTLLIFTTDNGGPISGGVPECPICDDSIGSSNQPLRGGKHSLWLGGVKGRALVWAPNQLSAANMSFDGIMHVSDWFPTVLAAAGVNDYVPNPALPLHSVNQWPLLTSLTPSNHSGSARQEVLFNIDPLQNILGPYVPNGGGNAGIRVGDWALLLGAVGPPNDWSPDDVANVGMGWTPVYEHMLASIGGNTSGLWPIKNQTTLLYNMTADPGQHNDVSALYPEVVAQLRARLDYWATEVMVRPYFCYDNCTDPLSPPSRHNGSWVPWMPTPLPLL